MREVCIIGIGQTRVAEHWEKSLRQLALEAISAALTDAGIGGPDAPIGALFVGNMIAQQAIGQSHLGAHIADFCGYRGIEACTVEAACASGAAALRAGIAAVASGEHDLAAVCGVEKMTDTLPDTVTAALATAADAEYEVDQGATFVAINAMLMRRYQQVYNAPHDAFAPFSINAHRNAAHNAYAMFQFPISAARYASAPVISPPINIMDSSPICDGAAAVILCARERAGKLVPGPAARWIRILGSASATDTLALHDRPDFLYLEAAARSAARAYAQAGIGPAEVDVFELHDAFSIMAVLSLEACGFAPRGGGYRLALEDEISIEGRIPISTQGGLKARGHPVGASGVYQVVEVAGQLRGEAGHNQVQNARIGMAQSIGGSGATVVTHLLAAGS